MLSVIIPARNEVYLERTIRNILENAEGEIEVIAELDGYVPNPQIVMNDSRVVFVHHEQSIGQRQCVNHGASIAKGEFIMKLDAHCAVDKGFDVKLAKDCEYDWTVIPRMYNLDHETWKPKLHKRTDYMYIRQPDFRAEYYNSRQPKNDKMIDDTMCCMGPGFFMHKKRFLELGGMDEGHGGWGQMGVELACKAWLSGGALKVNKNTWFAHWFRGGGGPGFPYPISGKTVEKARDYSRDLWLNNKWPLQKRKFEWMLEKFKPIGWGDNKTREMMRYPRWRGVRVLKSPSDLLLYEQILWDRKPDFLIECGTAYGGSALYFADIFNMIGKGHVISIDIGNLGNPPHPRVTYITGRTTASDTLEKVRSMVNGTAMVILDSDHSRVHVKRELHYYSPMVTKNQYIVVEDIYRHGKKDERGPYEAVEWFLKRHKSFKRDNVSSYFGNDWTRDGWLIRR